MNPRRHVLVEPDRNVYRTFINPLLKVKGSKYRHVPDLSDLFSGAAAKYLPDQTPLTSNVVSEARTNDSLLILANFGSLKSAHVKFDSTASNKIIHRYINGIMNPAETYHHYGLVRMLVWIRDTEKKMFLPRTVSHRKKFTVRLDLVAQVAEIAGCARVEEAINGVRRQHDLAVESMQLASERAKDHGLWDPESRRAPPPSPAWFEIEPGPDALSQLRSLPQRLPWHDEIIALQEAWDANPESKVKPIKAKNGRPRSAGPENLRHIRAKFLTMRKAKAVAHEWARRQNELDREELRIWDTAAAASPTTAQKEAIQQKKAALHTEIRLGRADLIRFARKCIDDRRGFEQQPSLLQWDRRTGNPLIVADNEFYPENTLSLLDFQPVPTALLRLSDIDKRTCFDYLCGILFRNPSAGIRAGLATAVQGGLDDFLARVPDLRNPLKGGNPNLDDLRPRTLPLDLLVQLALALETWPFRPQTHEMMMASRKVVSNVLLED